MVVWQRASEGADNDMLKTSSLEVGKKMGEIIVGSDIESYAVCTRVQERSWPF